MQFPATIASYQWPASVSQTKDALNYCRKFYPEYYDDYYAARRRQENEPGAIVDRLKALLKDIDYAFALIPVDAIYHEVLRHERKALQKAILLLEDTFSNEIRQQ